MNFHKNTKQVKVPNVKVPNLMVLSKDYFEYLILSQNFDFKKLSTLLIGSFLKEVTFLK